MNRNQGNKETEETEKRQRFRQDRSQRFFLPPEAFSGERASSEDAALLHQLLHVLRMNEGDEVLLLDGKGSLYQAAVEKLKRNRVDFVLSKKLISEETSQPEAAQARLRIVSLLPLIKGPRLEWALEKLTEVGVDVIQPFVGRRSVIKVKDEMPESKSKKRWQHIIQEAAEQCERLTLPLILPAQDLNDVVGNSKLSLGSDSSSDPCELRIHLSERSQAPDMVSYLYNHPAKPGVVKVVKIVSGPEGGFTEEEKEALKAAGYEGVSLGSNILRAETAAILGVALANNFLRRKD